MAKIRVYELAKKLNMTNKVLLSKLKAMNIDVKSHMSSLEDDIAVQIKNNLLGHKKTQSDIRVKSSVIRRRKQKDVLPVQDKVENSQELVLPVDSEGQLLSKVAVQKDSAILEGDLENKTGREKKSQLAHKVSKKDDKKADKSGKTGEATGKKSVDPAIVPKPVEPAGKSEKSVEKPAKTTKKPAKPDRKRVKHVESAKIIKPAKNAKAVGPVEPAKIKTLSEHKAMVQKGKEEHVSSVEIEKSVQAEPKEEKQSVADQKAVLKGKTDKILKTESGEKSEKDIKDMKKSSDPAEVELKTETSAKKKSHDKIESQKATEISLGSEAQIDSKASIDSGTSLETDGGAGSQKVSADKKSSDSDIKKKRRRKKKNLKKSTPAKIIRMAVPLPVKPPAKKDEHGGGG